MGMPRRTRSAWAVTALVVAVMSGLATAAEAPKTPLDELEGLHFQKPQPPAEKRRKLLEAWVASQPKGKLDESRLDREIARLGAEKFAERKAATDTIIAMGPWVTKALKTRLLKEKDPEIRARLREVLQRQYKGRFVCARRLGNAVLFIWRRMPPKEQARFAEPLVDALCREPAWIRWTAGDAGRELDERTMAGEKPYPRNPLSNAPLLFGFSREYILGDIVKVLAKQNTPEANRLVLRFLRKPNYLLPVLTIRALSQSRRKGIDAPLEVARFAVEAKPRIMGDALSALGRMDLGPSREAVLALLRKMAEHPYTGVAAAAQEALLRQGDAKALPETLRRARSGSVRERRVALRVLGSPALRPHAGQIVPVLTRALKSADRYVVAAALRALGAFPGTGPIAAPLLRSSERTVRDAAIAALARQPDPAALETLKGLRAARMGRRAKADLEAAIKLSEQGKKD